MMMKTNKILGILMAVLMVAGAVALVSARPLPEDCVGVIAHNLIPEDVNVTSYYGDGTVKESFIIPAHYPDTPSDAVQISVPKNGYVGTENLFVSAQKENGRFISSIDVHYVDSTTSPSNESKSIELGSG